MFRESRIFESNVDVYPFGNVATATAFLQGVSVEDIDNLEIMEPQDPLYSICIGIVARKKK